MQTKKKQPEFQAAFFAWLEKDVRRRSLLGSAGRCGFGGCLAKTVAEFLDTAAHVVHGFLRAGVKRVRLARCVELVQGQFATVFHRHHFFGVHAGACDEFEVVGQVHKTDFAVVGVNAVFHDVYIIGIAEPNANKKNEHPGVLIIVFRKVL